MGTVKRAIPASALVVLGVLACAAPGDAQTVIDEKGAWRIAAPRDVDTAPDKFSLSTPAIDRTGAKFSLSCRKDSQVYYFAIENPNPTQPPPDAVPRFSIRVAKQDLIWFQTDWRAGGGINVQEGVHQTAFSIMRILLTEPGATTVEFSIGDQQSAFSLDGFSDLTGVLRQRCGHEFAPERRPRR
jgi:hypothetical protein